MAPRNSQSSPATAAPWYQWFVCSSSEALTWGSVRKPIQMASRAHCLRRSMTWIGTSVKRIVALAFVVVLGACGDRVLPATEMPSPSLAISQAAICPEIIATSLPSDLVANDPSPRFLGHGPSWRADAIPWQRGPRVDPPVRRPRRAATRRRHWTSHRARPQHISVVPFCRDRRGALARGAGRERLRPGRNHRIEAQRR